MAAIRVIYESEPDFPPTDQHPDAVRYQVGEYWVDAIGCEAGGAPALEEVDKVLEDLGRLLYREKREERAKIAQQIIDRVKGFL
jgi:hypothetical protein